jgi:uncharacterized protein YjbJ (UPF0337 family)
MDKNTVEGKGKDIKGRIKRQVGEWTGDAKLQDEGTMNQAEGKVQNAWGKLKDAAHEATSDSARKKDDKAA